MAEFICVGGNNGVRVEFRIHGQGSVEKSLAKFQRRLVEHQKKLDEIRKSGGHTSSVEREIRNFQQQIRAIKKVLRR